MQTKLISQILSSSSAANLPQLDSTKWSYQIDVNEAIDRLHFTDHIKAELKLLCHRHIEADYKHITIHTLAIYANTQKLTDIYLKNLPDDCHASECFAYCELCDTYLRKHSIYGHINGVQHEKNCINNSYYVQKKEKKEIKYCYFLIGAFNDPEARKSLTANMSRPRRKNIDREIRQKMRELDKKGEDYNKYFKGIPQLNIQAPQDTASIDLASPAQAYRSQQTEQLQIFLPPHMPPSNDPSESTPYLQDNARPT